MNRNWDARPIFDNSTPRMRSTPYGDKTADTITNSAYRATIISVDENRSDLTKAFIPLPERLTYIAVPAAAQISERGINAGIHTAPVLKP